MCPAAVAILFLLAAICFPAAAALPQADEDGADAKAMQARVEKLIAQLGHEEFGVRERAQQELSRMGAAAFDALYYSQDADDIEVALRARFLIRSMRIKWVQEDDPADVKRILEDYSELSGGERTKRMQRLAVLPDNVGVPALCRMVRFERSEQLSKQAALLIVRRRIPDSEADRQRLARRVTKSIGISRRPAARWLRTYATTLDDPPATVEEWETLVKEERRTHSLTPQETSPTIVRDLIRWQAELLQRIDRPEAALAAMRRATELIGGDENELRKAIDWLIEREGWPVIEELAVRYKATFDNDAMLLYGLAEARLKQGRKEEATATADKASKLNEDEPSEHVVVAYALQSRGMFDWAEREYRQAADGFEQDPTEAYRARLMLSEMLHDQGNDMPAAKVLQPIVDKLEEDPESRRFLIRQPEGVLSRMHYFYAEGYRKTGNQEKQMAHLEKALQADPTDADVLIAMYRLENPSDQWRKKTLAAIKKAVAEFQSEIGDLEAVAKQTGNESRRAIIRRQLASYYNQAAWLIGNTTGDYEQAVRYAHSALDAMPDTAAYLDTLGRAYYATGDLKNALKYQRRAVQLEPYSGLIAKQLKLFEQKAEEQ